MEIDEKKGIAHPRMVIGFSRDIRSKSKYLDMEMVAMLFDCKGRLIYLSDMHRFFCETKHPGIRCRHTSVFGYQQEYLIDLEKLPMAVHSLAFAIRVTEDGHRDGHVLSHFTVESTNVENLSIGKYDKSSLQLLFAVEYDREDDTDPINVFSIAKLYRDREHPHEWTVHCIALGELAYNTSNDCVIQMTQVQMLDIIPELKIDHVNKLTTIEGLCGTLRSEEFPLLKAQFPPNGLAIEPFARTLLKQLALSRPLVNELSKASQVAKLLFQLFEQIDINEDLRVDWDEFTSFCVMVGMITTDHQNRKTKEVLCDEGYHEEHIACARKFEIAYKPILRLRFIPAFHQVLVLEASSRHVAVFGSELSFQHNFEIATSGFVLDVCYIAPTRVVSPRYAVACADRHVQLWAILNPRSGTYVYISKIRLLEPLAQILDWPNPSQIVAITSRHQLVQVDLELEQSQALQDVHSDYVTDLLYLPDVEYVATCALDHRIVLWKYKEGQFKSFLVLRGPTQGIKHLSYGAHRLICSGFEHAASLWFIREEESDPDRIAVLDGHLCPIRQSHVLVKDAQVPRALTWDESGKGKVWDISLCWPRPYTSQVVCLQTFQSESLKLGRQSLLVPTCHAESSQKFSDLITNDVQGLIRFRVHPHRVENDPICNLTFNCRSKTFLGTIKNQVCVWNAQSGEKIQLLTRVEPEMDVGPICFAIPRQRKLFLADETGALRKYNPVSGSLMSKMDELHREEITVLIYCKDTQCIITAGKDRRICISRDTPGQNEIDILRQIDRAHDEGITCGAYNANMAIVLSGDSLGQVRGWNFETVEFLFQCEDVQSSHEITALEFVPERVLFVSANSGGQILLFSARQGDVTRQLETLCIAQFLSPSLSEKELPWTITSLVMMDSTPQKVLILAADEGGNVTLWDWNNLNLLSSPIQSDSDNRSSNPLFNPFRVLINSFSFEAQLSKVNVLKRDATKWVPSKQLVPSIAQWFPHREGIYNIGRCGSNEFYTCSRDSTCKIWRLHHDNHTTTPSIEGILRTDETKKGQQQIPWIFGTTISSEPTEHHRSIAKSTLEAVICESTGKQKSMLFERLSNGRISRPSSRGVKTPKTFRRDHQLNDMVDKIVAKELDPWVAPSFKVLEGEVKKRKPFSIQSIRQGINSGKYGGEESGFLDKLREQLGNCRSQTPLFESTAKLLKASASTGDLPTDSKPLRNCSNFNAEVTCRRLAKLKHIPQIDCEPSDFLRQQFHAIDIKVRESPMKSPLRKPKHRVKPIRLVKIKHEHPQAKLKNADSALQEKIRNNINRKLQLSKQFNEKYNC